MKTIERAVTEESRASLLARVRAMHQMWEYLTKDLEPRHVDHLERSGVLPIAFSLTHGVTSEDHSLTEVLGGTPLWNEYKGRVRLTGERPRRGTPIAVAEQVRIGDMDAWREYQRAVFARTEREIAALPVEKLGAHHEVPARAFAGGFLALLAGTPDRVRVVDALEAWIFQHGIRHAGELEHARALVGLQGVT